MIKTNKQTNINLPYEKFGNQSYKSEVLILSPSLGQFWTHRNWLGLRAYTENEGTGDQAAINAATASLILTGTEGSVHVKVLFSRRSQEAPKLTRGWLNTGVILGCNKPWYNTVSSEQQMKGKPHPRLCSTVHLTATLSRWMQLGLVSHLTTLSNISSSAKWGSRSGCSGLLDDTLPPMAQ